MEQTPWQLHLRSHSQNLSIIEEQLNIRLNRFAPFHSLFLDLVKTLDRFTSSLNSISDKIQEQILSSSTYRVTQSMSLRSLWPPALSMFEEL